MSHWHTFTDKHYAYFVTCTVVEWLPLFADPDYRNIVLDSLAYSHLHKQTQLNAFVVMPTHLHALLWPADGLNISDILRDFKRHTSKAISQLAIQKNESDRLEAFEKARQQHKADESKYQVWQEGSHSEAIFTLEFARQKMTYIHNNPVKAGLVSAPEDWLYSSAAAYLSGKETYPPTDILTLNIM